MTTDNTEVGPNPYYDRLEIAPGGPRIYAFRPKPETIAAIEKDAQANAQAVEAIKLMMGRHVENWPDHKNFGTSLGLIDKTITAAISRFKAAEAALATLAAGPLRP